MADGTAPGPHTSSSKLSTSLLFHVVARANISRVMTFAANPAPSAELTGVQPRNSPTRFADNTLRLAQNAAAASAGVLMYPGAKLAQGAMSGYKAVEYFVQNYHPSALRESTMSMFGFDPSTEKQECPKLRIPPLEQIQIISGLVGGASGQIYTGVIDLAKYQDGTKHFYLVAANCGNFNTIASNAQLTPDALREHLCSPLGMIATWAGCMMAGGATIHTSPESVRALDDLSTNDSKGPKGVFGRGDLTFGNDKVELSDAQRISTGGSVLNTFLARTSYFHTLVGSVLHMQYVSATGDMCWFWVGAGGKGFISRHVNNEVAIRLDIGMWPDMARSIMKFYNDPKMIRLFGQSDPSLLKQLTKELIRSTESKKSTFENILQRAQVAAGYPERAWGAARHLSINEVKGQ